MPPHQRDRTQHLAEHAQPALEANHEQQQRDEQWEALQRTVFDIEAAHAELVGRGVVVSEVFHDVGACSTEPRAPGR